MSCSASLFLEAHYTFFLTKVYRVEPPISSSTISHLPCHMIPVTSTSPNHSSPIAIEISQGSSGEYEDVAVNSLSSSKSTYAFNQPQDNIKADHGYPTHYNIPPMVFVPTSETSEHETTEPVEDIGPIHNPKSSTINTSSTSPVDQIQNVGTIMAENNAMLLQDAPVSTQHKYVDCHTQQQSSSNHQTNNNVYHQLSGHSISDTNESTLSYENTFNPLR